MAPPLLADPLLRATGVLLLVTAWRAGVGLHALPTGSESRGELLALIAFLGASTGGAATLLGAHLFDQVAIASRWGQPPALDALVAVALPDRPSISPARRPSTDSRPPDRLRSASA